ncbi:MAG: MASE1 domain-containing protein [Gammaproteobacteria bacterium]
MRNVAIILIVTALYALTAELSQYLALPGTIVSAVWPPAGIALASLLILGNRALIGIFLGCFIADFHIALGHGVPFYTLMNALIPSIGAVIQSYVGKSALRIFSGSYNIFKNTKSILVFILISAFCACVINASLGVPTFLLTGNLPYTKFFSAWFTWWIADAVGVITVASTIIAWYQSDQEKISYRELFKLMMTWLLILIVGYIMLYKEARLIYLLIPFAIWSSFQFKIRYSLLTGLLISSVCLHGAIHRNGGMIQTDSGVTSISLVQIFISIIYLTILLINSILSDRQKAYNSLHLLNADLEERILERTKDLSESNQQLELEKNKALQAYEVLKHSNARLMQSEKMASLGVLTAGVAHEIKNPLNAISANIESIKTDMDHIVQSVNHSHVDKNIIEDVNRTRENTGSLITATNEGIKRTSGIIADLCAFARADEPEMIMSDIHQHIDSTLNLLNSEIKGHVTVIKEYGIIPTLLCHPGKLNQVIMNLIINAIHALDSQRDGRITIQTKQKDNSIILSIKDNGPGIKKEVLEKIFVPFFTTKQSGLGSGLGLFISSNIIKEHHGTISVTSEVGKGTEFIITLPKSEG